MEFHHLTAEEAAKRDEIIFGKPFSEQDNEEYYWGGTRAYSGLTPEQMRKLIELGFADPEEEQNDCPSIEECLEFCERHPGFTMHGYVVSHERHDCRVSVEGVEAAADTVPDEGEEYEKLLHDYVDTFRHADDFTIGGKGKGWHCWFD